MLKNLREYGKSPFRVAVIHGGPGAPGTMAPIARELSSNWGILEPLQTSTSLNGQLLELKTVLEDNGDLPVTLVGSSWGAMLSFIFAARFPELINKVFLVGSAVYEERYAGIIMQTRLNRLCEKERLEAKLLIEKMNDERVKNKSKMFSRLGELFTMTDAFDPVTLDTGVLEYQYGTFQSVWKEAKELRASGKLLELGKNIQCPVVIIHGDYDPHPIEGITKPLSSILNNLDCYVLKDCGHLPWIERHARERFFSILKNELSNLSHSCPNREI